MNHDHETTDSTLTRSDVEWAPDGSKPCTCGDCIVCEVEALAGEEPHDSNARF